MSENWPAYGVILGDEDLNTDTDDQLVTYLAPDRVAEVSSYLAEVTESEFGVRYDAMATRRPATRSTAPTSAGTPGAGFRKWRTFSSARPESVATWYSPCGSDSPRAHCRSSAPSKNERPLDSGAQLRRTLCAGSCSDNSCAAAFLGDRVRVLLATRLTSNGNVTTARAFLWHSRSRPAVSLKQFILQRISSSELHLKPTQWIAHCLRHGVDCYRKNQTKWPVEAQLEWATDEGEAE